MEQNYRWKIYWKDEMKDAFGHGATIKFLQKDDVYYENELISPGTVIKQWTSMTNFQLDRAEPALPIIDGERRIRIKLDVDMDIEEGLLLRIIFFQKNGTVVGSEVLRGSELEFKCPITTYYYQVQLICGGSYRFHFHSFSIEELGE
jgi:accessory Sec system protein Asp3